MPSCCRRGSTPVSTVLRKSVRFFIINIFLIIKNTFQVETWAICYLSDSKTQERGLKELNTKTFLGKPAPQTPLDSACAFGPRLGNRPVFFPDARLEKDICCSFVSLQTINVFKIRRLVSLFKQNYVMRMRRQRLILHGNI